MIDLRKLYARRLAAAARRPVSRIVVTPLEDRVQPAAPLQFFYVPMPETQVNGAFAAVMPAGKAVSATQDSSIYITATENNTRIVYDQWEDGYEVNLATPTQSSTQIWGDGDNTNGIAPGFGSDPAGIPQGTVLKLRNVVNTPRDTTAQPLLFDAPDRFGSDHTLAVSRLQFPVTVGGGAGSVIASAVEVRDTRYYDTAFTAPVGTDTANQSVSGQNGMFSYAAFYVQAAQDKTHVQIDANNDGDFADPDDRDVTINRGQTVTSGPGVLQGGRVVSDKPVQTNLFTAQLAGQYAARTYALYSDNQVSNDYFTPVGFEAGGTNVNYNDVRLYVYNPNAAAITVTRQNSTNADANIVIPAKSSVFIDVTTDTGTRLFTASKAKFLPIGVHDSPLTGNATDHDWGFNLQPTSALSQIAVVGLGIGNSGNPPSSATPNGSPVWVTALADTTLHVDDDGDGTVDRNIAVNKLQTVRLFDVTDNDNDQSGMKIFTTDGTLISVAWGEAAVAPQAAPGLDAGTTIPAVPVPEFYKLVGFAPGGDTNGDGFYNSGDVLRYTLRIRNIGATPVSNLALTDALPAEVLYVTGSTVYTQGATTSPIPDDGTGTTFPLDNTGYTVANADPGSVTTIVFDVVVRPNLPTGTTTVSNGAFLKYDVFNLPAVVDADLRGAIGDHVFRDDDANGLQNGGEPGIAGVTVDLYRDVNNSGTLDGGDTLVGTQTTDATGFYQFANLDGGKYVVNVTDTANKLANTLTTTTNPRAVTLTSGGAVTDADFGYRYVTNLTATKDDGVATITPGTQVTYTITVTNSGPLAVTGATVADTLPAILTGASWTAAYTNGSGPTTGTGNINATVNLNAGGSVTFTVTATVSASATGSLTNTVTVTPPAGFVDTVPGDNSAADTDTLTPTADLSLTKTVPSLTPQVGTLVTFTITVPNGGPSDATGVAVRDLLPSGFQYVGDTGGGSYNSGTGVWTIGTIATGTSATLQITARVLPTGSYTNYAEVSASNTPDPDSAPNNGPQLPDEDDDASVTLTPTPAIDLSLTNTVSNPTPAVGTTITYTLVLSNATGVNTATGIGVQDILPAGVTFVSSSDPTYNPALGDNVWNVPTLASGGSATLVITVRVNTAALGAITDFAQVTAANEADIDSTPNNGPNTPLEDDEARATITPTALTVGDTVFFDANGDGLSAGDPGIPNATVTIRWFGPDGTDNTGDEQTFSAITNAAGVYSIGDLPAGTYSTAVTGIPAGLPTQTTGPATFTLAPGSSRTDIDFGYRGLGVIGDRVFLDVNNNNSWQAGEGIANVTVTLSGDVDGDGVAESFTTTTDGDGFYQFTGLRAPAGGLPYTVTVSTATLPAGLTNTTDPDGNAASQSTVTLSDTTGTNNSQDFGYRGPGSLGDRVFLDVNNNGVWDAGEGLNGVTVKLTADLDGDTIPETISTVTGPDGFYQFSGLRTTAGGVSYALAVDATTLPVGLVSSKNPPGGTNGTSTTTLTNVAFSDPAQDFGYRGTGTIGDRVFLDVNNNGVYDAGEGLDGVTVTLTGDQTGDGTPETVTAVTGSDGLYQFDGVRTTAGGVSYTVTIAPATLPGGVTNTADPDGGTVSQSAVTLMAASPTNNNQDFGYQGTGKVGDRIFLDVNGDNLWQAGEGLAGVTVTLSGDVDGDGVAETFTTTTDGDGFYQFANLPVNKPNGTAITYTATVTAGLPAGVTNTADPDGTANGTTSFDLTANPTRADIDFGYKGAGSVGDRVFLDLNGDNQWNPGEGITGVTVTLSADIDGDGTPETFTAVTDADGFYQFANLPVNDPAGNPISYTVTVGTASLPAGVTPSADRDGTLDNTTTVTLSGSATRADIDFGYQGTGSVGDRVWLDADGNAGQGPVASEPGLPGVGLTLTFAGQDNTFGTADDITTTITTGVNGAYTFANLPAGTVRVAVNPATLPTPLMQTYDLNGPLDGAADVTLTAGESRTDADFGYVGTGSVGDRVFLDLNGDNQWNPGEGITGITVTLTGDLNGDGTPETFTAVTDADGFYQFVGLPVNLAGGVAVSYTATVDPTNLPPGVAASKDADGTPNGTTTFTLSGSATRADIDFGYQGTGSVGDRVWLDADGNAGQGPVASEPGLPGVGLTLTFAGQDNTFGTADDITATTTSGLNGAYIFANLPAGTFRVAVNPTTLPGPTTETFDRDDVTPTLDGVANVVLAAGQTRTDVDFGYQGTGSVGDRVFLDLNGDGVWTAGEGISGITVTLTGDLNGDGTPETFTAVTGADGFYQFAGLPVNAPAGTSISYTVAVGTANLPAGVTNTADPDGTTDSTTTFTFAGSATRTDIDFGYKGTGSLGDTVFIDANGDGVQQPASEPGLPGVGLTLAFAGPDGVLGTADDITTTTTTNSTGGYSFANLPAGSFRVTVNPATLPGGMTPTADRDDAAPAVYGVANVALATGQTRTDVDFGYRGTGSAGDRVFLDLNGDGIWNIGEGITGVTVTLTGDLNGDGTLETFTTTTDADGFYQLPGLPVTDAKGAVISYTVSVSPAGLPVGVTSATDPDGGVPNGSATFTLSGNPNPTTLDFGYKGTGGLGDTVFVDANGDGVQLPASEPGLPGVGLTLTFAGQDGVFGTADDITTTTTTNGSGGYTFANLPAGSVRVTVNPATLPTGAKVTADRDDANPVVDGTANVSLTAGQVRTDVDFGYNGANLVGDRVFLDLNGDGVWTPGEGIAGVTVTLTGDLDGDGKAEVFTAVTDADGGYTFPGLPVADQKGMTIVYTATVSPADLPAGIAPSVDADGTADGTTTFTLLGNPTRLDIDFGYKGTGGVGDTVFVDANGDGVQLPASEPGLPGVGLTLTFAGQDGVFGTADDIATTTTTNGSGGYTFANLPAGTVRVTVDPATLPGGMTATNNPGTSVVLVTGQSRTDIDFGYRGPGVIGDRIFLDVNSDGVWNPGEGLAGVTVTLTGDLNGDGTPETFTVTTDGDGRYAFPGLPATNAAGNLISYTVTVTTATLPGALTNTVDPDGTPNNATTLTLVGNPTRSDLDFGYKGPGSIGDRVFLDLNGDGVWNPGEGVTGVTVTLTADVDGDGTPETFTAVTDADGGYVFNNLPVTDPAGKAIAYTLSVNPAGLPAGLAPSVDLDGTPDGTTTFTLAANPTRTDVDFGYKGTGVIGDRVFVDGNGDGVQNPGEPGLPGVGLTLTFAGQDGVFGTADDITTTTTTGPDGSYTLPNLPAGTFRVTVDPATLPGGVTATNNPGANVTLTPGQVRTDIDFGYKGPGTAGDHVFLDLNGDGVWNPGEGVTGVTVTLTGDLNGDGTPETFTAVTDADGGYTLPGLPVNDPTGKPIVYTLAVNPAGLPGGVTNTIDPDGTPNNTTTFTLTADPIRTDLDFGYLGAGRLGDRVWIDANGDGGQGPTAQEPGLPGVRVILTYLGQDGVFGTADDINTTTITGADGKYTLPNLPAGTFRVTVDATSLPSNVTPTFDGGNGVTLTPGQSRTDVDFGFQGAASVGQSVYVDQNGNGVQDPTEPGVPGAAVVLVGAGPDGVLGTADDLTFSTTTAADGTYNFPGLPVYGPTSPYQITVTAPVAGLNPTGDPDGVATPNTAVLNVPAATPFDAANFGYDGAGQSLSGSVYDDRNGNGVRDPGEPGIAGATVRLSGTNVFGSPVVNPDTGLAYYEAATDADGNFAFTNVFPGTYTIIELQPAPFTDGGETAGTLGGTVTDDQISGIVVGVGGNGSGYTFGENRPSSISGTVFRDDNANGVQNAGEPGIPNVRVTLTGTDDRGNPVSITVVTDAAGTYTFAGLRPGTYRISELQPAGYEQGQNQVGSAGGQLAATDRLDAIVLGAGVAAVNYQFAETNPVRPAAVAPLPPLTGPAPATDMSKRDFLASTPTPVSQTIAARTTPDFAALGSVNTNRPTQFVATADGVGGNLVRVFDLSDGTERFRFQPFPGNPGGTRVTTADVTGDGIPDIVTAAGPGGAPRVIVYDGNTGAVLQDFLAFEGTFTGGLYVSAGDLDGDGRAEIVVSPDVGGGPRVKVVSGTGVMADFLGIDDPNFRGGARTAVGDVNGDGTPDLVVGAGVGGGPRVAVWGGRSILSGSPTHLVADWFAFESTLRNGVYLTVGDVDGDGKADIIAGGGPGGAPRVVAFSGAGLMANQTTLVANYFVGNTADRGGVPVAAVDVDGDGRTEVFTGAGEGSTPIARFSNPRTGQVIDEFAAEYLEFLGGVQVG